LESEKRKQWYCLSCYKDLGQIFVLEIIDEDHHKCPICGIEVWFPMPGMESQKVKNDLTTNSYISRSLPEKYKVPPGGSKSGKRAKKKGAKTFLDNGFEGFLK